MLDTAVINDARVMSKGQVTIPKNIRAILGIAPGDRVTFVAEKDSVRVVNSAVYAMQNFKKKCVVVLQLLDLRPKMILQNGSRNHVVRKFHHENHD